MSLRIRKPSLTKSIAARTSINRYVRHHVGLKAPRGWGWLTNPKRAACNRAYQRSTLSLVGLAGTILVAIVRAIFIKPRRRR